MAENMIEYIEREKAREFIKNYGKGAIEDGRKALDPVDDIIDLAKGIDLIPAANVRRNAKGEWIRESFINKRGEKMFHSPKCSACGSNETFTTKFCPNCGADMRKGGAG